MTSDKKYMVLCTLVRANKTVGIFAVELEFQDGKPFAVFEGPDQPILVSLNPQYLHQTQGWQETTHMYEVPIQDPREYH
ncbi:hypothetical protein SAMN05192560_0753 [Methylobacillus rhizosphaerae]|uniref:Uncharacterized protein n=1 Tax=Methylobacillus rhizosphaerae TaxID=551994 RepID=A0A238YRN0_9PROT|nr:hypothetical protein [Methylobacillus rhizosphaerae]SNR73314.1 hypothetical protein SAMN05192560_0753 [Methylobacillus rhizosphaerae]